MLLVKKGFFFFFHHTLIWWSLCIIKSHSHAFDIRNMHTLSPRIIFFSPLLLGVLCTSKAIHEFDTRNMHTLKPSIKDVSLKSYMMMVIHYYIICFLRYNLISI